MSGDDPRAALERLSRERGDDYAALSRLLGRNPAYVQQYIKRGSPRRLAEDDRRLLARYFGVDEAVLGGPPRRGPSPAMIAVPRLDVGASAGAGVLDPDERRVGGIAFDPQWLRSLGFSALAARELSLIRVEGDSMSPTLSDGDDILVDGADSALPVRDGIYVLRIESGLVVKRVGLAPGGRVSVRSDNDAYPGWPDADPADLAIVGRVVWVGRRLL